MASLTVPKVATAVLFDQHKGPLRVERKWPIVEPEVGEVLVKIAYSGVCRESTAVAAIRKEGSSTEGRREGTDRRDGMSWWYARRLGSACMVSFSRVYPLLEHFLVTRAPTLQRTGYRHGDWADKPKLPLIGGHEGCGEPRFFLSSS